MKKTAVIAGSYALLLVFLFGGALFPGPHRIIFGDDITHQYYYYREFFLHFFRQGIVPWWNPYNFSGTPFIANPAVTIWYPGTWLFLLLPLNIAYSWHIALHLLIAMTGMYLFISNLKSQIPMTKQNTHQKNDQENGSIDVASWVGGVVFGLSGFFVARIWAGHVDIIAAASWMPWVVWGFYRLHHAVGARVSASPSSVGPLRVAGAGGPPGRGPLVGVPGGKLLTGPAGTFLRVTMPENAHLPARGIALASILFAFQLYAGYQTMAFFTVEAVIIVVLFYCFIVKSFRPLLPVAIAGLLGLGLAGLQLIPEQQFFRETIRTYALPYRWTSYGALTFRDLLSFISPFPFGNQMNYRGPVPNYWEHAAYLGRVGLTLAIVGCLSVLWTMKRKRIEKSWSLALAMVVITVFGFWMSFGPNAPVDLQHILWSILPPYHYLRIPTRHVILVVFGMSALAGIGLGALRNRTLRIVITLAVVGEMLWYGKTFITLSPIPGGQTDPTLVSLFKKDVGPYRVLQDFGVWVSPRESLDFDSTMMYGIFSATGYDPSILRSYFDYVARASGQTGSDAVRTTDVQVPYLAPASGDALDFLNIKYILVPPAYDPFAGNARYVLVREDARRGYRVYENTTVKPRFFLDKRSCGTVRLAGYTPNTIRLDVDTTCAAGLVSSEVWYPGWTAYVNNKKVDMDRINGSFRSLFISRGNHAVIMVYEPAIFLIGGSVTMGSALILIWLLARRNTVLT
ncbi:YfhO family protein [Patescibacteria group bacterium]|nr:YfhO family protein [Patescibacteria group bacterium]